MTLLRSTGLRGLILVFALGWLLLHAVEWMGGPEELREHYGLGAAAILVPVHAVVAVTPFPSELVAVAHAAIYGFALGSAFLTLGRLVPFGNHVVNAMAGSARVSLWRFSWVSALAFVPFSVAFAAFASGIVER